MKARHQIQPIALKTTVEKIDFFGEVEFGIPSKDCKNFGICRVSKCNEISTERITINNCGCNSAMALITYLTSHALQMQFYKSSISSCTEKKYFSDAYFKIEENYPLVIPTISEDAEQICYTIQKGAYPILETSSHYMLYL